MLDADIPYIMEFGVVKICLSVLVRSVLTTRTYLARVCFFFFHVYIVYEFMINKINESFTHAI